MVWAFARSVISLAYLSVVLGVSNQLQELDTLVHERFATTGSPILVFDIPAYKKFVMDGPKDYHMLVIYAAGTQFCGICTPFMHAFERTALSHYMAGSSDVRNKGKPVYFGYVDFGLTADIPRMHGMTTLPHIFHIQGGVFDVQYDAMAGGVKLPDREFPITKLDVSVRDVLDWINKETHRRDVPFFMSSKEKFVRWAGIAAAAVLLVYLAIKLIVLCRRRPAVIVVVGLVIHYIATSGIFYNLLQGMQWVGKDGEGNVLVLMNSPRGQYLGEGLMMSALVMLGGLSMFAASRLPFTETGKRMNSTVLLYSLSALILTSTAAMYLVILAYIKKAGWYSNSDFAPPDYYRRGPLRIDQGNSF